MCLTAHLCICKGWGMKEKLPQGVCRLCFSLQEPFPALSSQHTFLPLAEGTEPFPEGREGAHAQPLSQETNGQDVEWIPGEP